MTTQMTTIEQDCSVGYDVNGAPLYLVATSVDYVKPGDLPFADIFVFQVNVPTDPKSDTFVRIASVADLSTYAAGREAAVTYYLTSTFTVSYSSISDATAAKATIIDRINALIADWLASQTAFFNPTFYTLPAVESTVVAAAKAAYETAKTNAATAAAAVVTATTAVTTAATNVASANAALTTATSNSMACQGNTAAASKASVTDFPAFLATCKDVLAHFTGGPTTYSLLAAYYNEFATAVNTQAVTSDLSALTSSMGTMCNALSAQVITAAAAKTSADAAAATAQTAVQAAQAAAAAATAAQNAALATVLAYCPTFDPTT